MAPSIHIRDALQDFYRSYHLKADGGIDDASAKVEIVKGFNVYIPNTDARRKVLVTHDIHHLLTGYPAVMKGELQISSWEISTGCMHNWVAFVLNYFGMLMGVITFPRSCWKAFLRGKVSKNLYREDHTLDELMEMEVDALRKYLGLSELKEIGPGTRMMTALKFVGFLLTGPVAAVIALAALPFLLVYSIYQSLTIPK